jgi:hypothetical protein
MRTVGAFPAFSTGCARRLGEKPEKTSARRAAACGRFLKAGLLFDGVLR